MIKMDEDENNDDNVWNAAGVILDIDSGMLNEIIYLFFFFFLTKLLYVKHPQAISQVDIIWTMNVLGDWKIKGKI